MIAIDEVGLTGIELSHIANADQGYGPGGIVERLEAAMAPLALGTARQIAAARIIRNRAIAKCLGTVAAARARGVDPARIAPVLAKIAKLAGVDDAAWWMDRKLDAMTPLCMYQHAEGTHPDAIVRM